MKTGRRSVTNQEPLDAPVLNGLFSRDFREGKRPIRTKSGKRPIKVRKRPVKDGKRPIKVMVLVGVSVGCLMGCFRAPPPKRKTAPLKFLKGLGGNFGPEKKYLAPPPPQFLRDTLQAPWPPPPLS